MKGAVTAAVALSLFGCTAEVATSPAPEHLDAGTCTAVDQQHNVSVHVPCDAGVD